MNVYILGKINSDISNIIKKSDIDLKIFFFNVVYLQYKNAKEENNQLFSSFAFLLIKELISKDRI